MAEERAEKWYHERRKSWGMRRKVEVDGECWLEGNEAVSRLAERMGEKGAERRLERSEVDSPAPSPKS